MSSYPIKFYFLRRTFGPPSSTILLKCGPWILAPAVYSENFHLESYTQKQARSYVKSFWCRLRCTEYQNFSWWKGWLRRILTGKHLRIYHTAHVISRQDSSSSALARKRCKRESSQVGNSHTRPQWCQSWGKYLKLKKKIKFSRTEPFFADAIRMRVPRLRISPIKKIWEPYFKVKKEKIFRIFTYFSIKIVWASVSFATYEILYVQVFTRELHFAKAEFLFH